MFKIYFTNFGYGPDRDFASLEEAIEFAKTKGFEASIIEEGYGVVGSWSPIGGYRNLQINY